MILASFTVECDGHPVYRKVDSTDFSMVDHYEPCTVEAVIPARFGTDTPLGIAHAIGTLTERGWTVSLDWVPEDADDGDLRSGWVRVQCPTAEVTP